MGYRGVQREQMTRRQVELPLLDMHSDMTGSGYPLDSADHNL
jgi:hypothetical protein